MSQSRLLMLVSLGPVQSFISTARKGSDLWFGSLLLSELARTSARAALASGATLLIPDPAALQNAQTAVPARLQLALPDGEWDPTKVRQPQDLAEKMRQAMSRRLKDLLDGVKRKVGDTKVLWAVAEDQLLDLPELAWVVVPMGDDHDYPRAFRLADRLLTGRKHLRPFAAPSWSSDAPKSSLDGARESVLPQAELDRLHKDPRQLWAQYRVRPREHLCGPGLLKRWAPRSLPPAELGDGARIQSTSHFAAWNLRKQWHEHPELQEALREAFENYLGTLKRLVGEALEPDGNDDDPVLGRHDASILFESRLPDLLVEAQALRRQGEQGGEIIEQARAALQGLYAAWRASFETAGLGSVPRPGAYYAVVVGDGDYMGQTLSRLSLPHVQELSGLLLRFADRARQLVGQHHGQVCYVGGDDLLLLLPLETALPCCSALAELFQREVGEPAARLPSVAGTAAEPPTPTLSVGLCIAHHLDPFQDTLAVAREAEHHAKQVLGRDAWAVTLRKRGGPPVTHGAKWSGYGEFDALLQTYLSDSGLPRGLAYDLRAAAERLHALSPQQTAQKPDLAEVLPSLWTLEAERIFEQKRLPDALRAQLRDLLRSTDLRGLANVLLVARALSVNEEDGQ